MTKRNIDPSFDPEEIENDDPLGEQMFAEAGFEDAPNGGPSFSAPGTSPSSCPSRAKGLSDAGGGGAAALTNRRALLRAARCTKRSTSRSCRASPSASSMRRVRSCHSSASCNQLERWLMYVQMRMAASRSISVWMSPETSSSGDTCFLSQA